VSNRGVRLKLLTVTRSIHIPESEVHLRFVQASGPGGQNVNKVASAVELRFDVRNSKALPEEVRDRLLRQAGRKVSGEGVLIIRAQRYRDQARNRQDAIERLIRLIQNAARRPPVRKRTRRPAAAVDRRLADKRRRAELKRGRVAPTEIE
jgi:ribosome-associated protein